MFSHKDAGINAFYDKNHSWRTEFLDIYHSF